MEATVDLTDIVQASSLTRKLEQLYLETGRVTRARGTKLKS